MAIRNSCGAMVAALAERAAFIKNSSVAWYSLWIPFAFLWFSYACVAAASRKKMHHSVQASFSETARSLS